MKNYHHFFKIYTFLGCALWISLITTGLTKPGNTVVLPAGSVDALANAISEAGPGGSVILEGGHHSESGTVLIDIPVSIIGEDGAVLRVATTLTPDVIDPALHIRDASGVVVEGLALLPPVDEAGDVAILIENAPHTTVSHTFIADHEVALFVQSGDHLTLEANTIVDMNIFGILHLNGVHAAITNNTIDGIGIYGIWLGDEKGQCRGNEISNAEVGILLCHFIQGSDLPDGSISGAEQPATRWHVSNNEVQDTVIGILATDGATLNLINNNDVSSSDVVDILLEGELVEDGMVIFPAAIENTVTLGKYKDVVVWDFGIGNNVNGVK